MGLNQTQSRSGSSTTSNSFDHGMLFLPSARRHRQLRISDRRLILMVGDTLAVVAAVMVALWVWSRVARYTFTIEFILPNSYLFFVMALLWLALASANDFYDLSLSATRNRAMQRLLSITAQLVVIYLLVFFISPRDALPRLFILYYGIASFTLIALWRAISPNLLGWAIQARRVLILGTGPTTSAIVQAIQQQHQKIYEIHGIISQRENDGIEGDLIEGIPVLGKADDLAEIIELGGISELVLTSTRDLSQDAFQGVMDAYERGVTLMPMPLLYEHITGQVPVEHVNDNWALVLPLEGSPLLSPYAISKRMIEVLLSLIGIIVLLPLLPLVALAIRLDSPGSIFYSQERVGLNGRIFRVYKFRTMRQDAEAQTGAVFSVRGDPRVTKLGRFMRKVRIDELPQLYNILRGDMSLIGPRPERPEHVARLTEKIPFYRTRNVIRPGLTGWAQVRYEYGSTDEDALIKLQYDLYYIRHQSLLLDLNILIRTVGRVLRMSGV
jgi:exopolysaccharide biosynthesis polyprenyl glycosylphosphotransferase